MKSIEGNFEEEKVNELLLKHFKELRSVSPANSCHVLDINGLKKDNFKRKNYGKKIIEHLIIEAKKLKINKLSLETGAGDFFKPARKLFKKCGFITCEPFAEYKEDIDSCYMSLNI